MDTSNSQAATPILSGDRLKLARWALLVPAVLLAATPLSAVARSKSGRAPAVPAAPVHPLHAELGDPSNADLLTFYGNRNYQPLWISPGGIVDPAARALVQLLQTAGYDGVDPAVVNVAAMSAAIARAEQEASPAARAHAERTLSRGFTAYVRAMRKVPAAEMAYESQALMPRVPSVWEVLREAAAAPSLAQYVSEMRWMHPLYAELRRGLVADPGLDAAGRQSIIDTLARVRALPANPGQRYVLVDAASARLWMYENGRPVDSMRVVVGKANQQTPLLAGYIRHAILNPYWNVPHDLVPRNIAPNARRLGVTYLKARGYQVLSDWSAEATVLDPKTVDWAKVARGEMELRVRQLPNATNAMGRVKYEFPNPQGIYLHDTPEKGLMLKDGRQFSSGCIRLEDAQRLGQWLFRGALPQGVDQPEQKVDLPQLVPVYVTYLTAHPVAGVIAIGPDPYRRNGVPAPVLAQHGVAGLAPQQQGPAVDEKPAGSATVGL